MAKPVLNKPSLSKPALRDRRVLNDGRMTFSNLKGWPDLELLRKLMLLNLTIEKMADIYNVSKSTFEHWLRSDEEFKAIYDEGRIARPARVARKLYERACGYEHRATKFFFDSKSGEIIKEDYTERYAPDVGAAKLYLSNFYKDEWRDRQSTEISGPDGSALAPPQFVINPVKAADKE